MFCKFPFDTSWSILNNSGIKFTIIDLGNPSSRNSILALKAKGTDTMHGLSYNNNDGFYYYWINDFA
jgi:hypothetical protein